MVTVYSLCLSVLSVVFGVGWCESDGYLTGKELVILPFMCVVGIFEMYQSFFHSW